MRQPDGSSRTARAAAAVVLALVVAGLPGRRAGADDAPKPKAATAAPADLSGADAADLIAAFESPSLAVRTRSVNELCDRVGAAAVGPLREALGHRQGVVRAEALWALFRLGSARPEDVAAAARDADRLVRVHAARVLGETRAWDPALRAVALRGLADAEPDVRRAFADALGRQPDDSQIDPLIHLHLRTPWPDDHLRHVVLLALRDNLRPPGALSRWASRVHDRPESTLVADVALGLTGPETGAYLIGYLKRHMTATDVMGRYLAHAAKNLPPDTDVDALATVAHRGVAGDLDLQLDLLLAVRDGLRQRRAAEPAGFRRWGADVARRLLDSLGPGAGDWLAVDSSGNPGPPWGLEPRRSRDAPGTTPFLSSLPPGEAYTGVLRSREFVLPARLRLWVCGHLGPPGKPAVPGNLVRLRLAKSGETVAEALAPRNDVARRVSWDLAPHAGKTAFLEVVDGLDLPAYAWIAVARFEPEVVALPAVSPGVVARRQRAAAELAGDLGLRDLEGRLRAVARAGLADPSARVAAARAVVGFHPDAARAAMLRVVADPAVAPALRGEVLLDATRTDGPTPADLPARLMRSLPARLQAGLAEALAETRDGGERLLALAEEGAASARLLQAPAVRDKLLSTRPADAAARVARLTAALPPIERETQRLIDARRAGFDRARALPARGLDVFKKHCAACHQVGGEGALVGPQLDGVGHRGPERLAEDVLDPSRNVDPAFSTTMLALTDGRALSGLFRRKEGRSIVLVDSTGKEVRVPADEVEDQRTTRLSPMPANYGSVLTPAEFNDLLAFLLERASGALAQQPPKR